MAFYILAVWIGFIDCLIKRSCFHKKINLYIASYRLAFMQLVSTCFPSPAHPAGLSFCNFTDFLAIFNVVTSTRRKKLLQLHSFLYLTFMQLVSTEVSMRVVLIIITINSYRYRLNCNCGHQSCENTQKKMFPNPLKLHGIGL